MNALINTLRVGWAMTYDFLLRGRTLFLQILLVPILPLIIYIIFARLNPITARDLRFILFMGLLIESLICTWSLGAFQSVVRPATLTGGFPPRLFTLPVSTPRLVFWQMLPGFAFIALMHLFLVVSLKLLTGTMPPFLAPSLYLSAMYAGTMAVIWALSDFVFWKLVALMCVGGALGSWMNNFYVTGGASTTIVWRSPLPWSLGWLALSILASYLVAVFGVHRDRRGDAGGLPGIEAAWNDLMDRLPQRQSSFASPQAAQLWLEWRQKGLIPIITLAFLFGLAGLWLFLRLKGSGTKDLLEFYLGFTFLGIVFLSVPFGLALGHLNSSPLRGELDIFRATRPLSDRALAFAVLRCGGLSILSSWLIGIAGLAVVCLWLACQGASGQVVTIYQSIVNHAGLSWMGLWAVPLLYLRYLLAAWTLLSILTITTMSGRGWLFGVLLTLLFIGFFGSKIILSQLTPDHESIFGAMWTFILGLVFLLGTSWAFHTAARHRLIGPALGRAGYACCLLAILLAAVCFRSEPLTNRLFAAGLLCLPTAPLALAPLALSWNRHR